MRAASTSYRDTERLDDTGSVASIRFVGDSYDNAMAEALNGTYAAELIRRSTRWTTRHQGEFSALEWTG